VSRKPASLLLLAFAAFAAVPATAGAVVESATSGAIAVTVGYEVVPRTTEGYEWHEVIDPVLTITREGRQVYSAPVGSPKPPCHPTGGEAFCVPAGEAGVAPNSVQVVELESDGEPDVLLHLWTGGAHCCYIDQVFRWSPSASTYTVTEREWGDASAGLVDLRHDGKLEFLTADDRFAYAFTDYARSGLPIQIWTFSDGAFTNVTRRFPSLVARDAASWWHYFKDTHGEDDVGVFASWAADEELLGHAGLVNRRLSRELRAHRLKAAVGPDHGRRFARDLRRDLRRWGYLH